MAEQNDVDFASVIEALERRREAISTQLRIIESAIVKLREAQAIMSGSIVPTGSTLTIVDPTLPQADQTVADPEAFYGLSVADAAKKYLGLVRRKQTNQELAQGLEKAGYVHSSTNFPNVVGTALWRAINDGDTEIFRQGRAWLLSEWFPGRRRSRKASPDSDEPTPTKDETAEVELDERNEVAEFEKELAKD